jgi:ketosteroid isomerase-like protein
MTAQSEIERNKAVAHAFYQAGVEGRLTSFAGHLDPDFTVTAPNYLPWGGPHKGAAFFSQTTFCPTSRRSFDFSRFSYVSVTAQDDRVAAIINMGVTGTDHVIKILDLWTVRNGKAVDLWVAYFEPQALLDKLGVAHGLRPVAQGNQLLPPDQRAIHQLRSEING